MVVDDDLSMCNFLRAFLSRARLSGDHARQRGRSGQAVPRRAAGGGHPRRRDAGRNGRARRARRLQEDRSRRAGHRALGPGPHDDRGAGDEARRVRLRQQAVRRGRPRGAAHERAAAASAQPRSRDRCASSCSRSRSTRCSSATASGWPRCAISSSASPTPTSPCSIRGESGTGKELVARALSRLLAPARQAVREGELRGAARPSCSNRSCSASSAARSPARSSTSRASSSSPTTARCSSTRSAT